MVNDYHMTPQLGDLSTLRSVSPGVAVLLAYSIGVVFIYFNQSGSNLYLALIAIPLLLVFAGAAVLTGPVLKRFFEPKIVASYLQTVDATENSSLEIFAESSDSLPQDTPSGNLIRLKGNLFDEISGEAFDNIDQDVFVSIVNVFAGLLVLSAPVVFWYGMGTIGALIGLVLFMMGVGILLHTYRRLSILIERTPERVTQ